MNYTYSIQNDLPNQKVDMGTLIDELKTNNIPVDNLIIQNDVLTIITLLDLVQTQLDSVDTILSNHIGNASTEIYTEQVKIIEENNNNFTQGIFQSCTIDTYISGVTGTTIIDKSFPYPISLFSSEWLVQESQIGDISEFHLAPDTMCGVLVAPHSSGDTTLYVSDTVFTQANIKLGHYITVNGQDLGRVIYKNSDTNTITIENPLETVLDPMTPVFFTVKVVPHWRFNAPGFCSVGETKIGSSYIPANTVMRTVYHNLSGTAKWFGISIDYLY